MNLFVLQNLNNDTSAKNTPSLLNQSPNFILRVSEKGNG